MENEHEQSDSLPKKKTLWETVKCAITGDANAYTKALESGKHPKRWIIFLALCCGFFPGFILGSYFTFSNLTAPVKQTHIFNTEKQTVATSSKNIDLSKISAGEYKVGLEIPEGEYKITQISGEKTYYKISAINANNEKFILKNGFVNNQEYVIVKNGQYLEVDKGNMTLLPSAKTNLDGNK